MDKEQLRACIAGMVDREVSTLPDLVNRSGKESFIVIRSDLFMVWLREKGYAPNLRNAQIGRRVGKCIAECNGSLQRKNIPTEFLQLGMCKNPSDFSLPATYSTYTIDRDQLSKFIHCIEQVFEIH
jgi:hypothetical protein